MTDLAAVLNHQQLGHLDALIVDVQSYVERHGKPALPILADDAWARSREARNVVELARAVDRDDPPAVAKLVHRLSGVITRWNLHLIACDAGKVRAARAARSC